MKKIMFITSAIVFFSLAGILTADDLVTDSQDVDSLYSDHKAYRVGDIVTILVVESTEGYQSASLKTEKSQKIGAGIGTSSWGGGTTSPFPYVPSLGAGAESYHDGGGKSSRSGGLIAKVSARVERVLSNGNCVIKGTKVIQINDDKQNLVVKGIIRPEDINADNTIYSTFVADASIMYEGKGPVGEKTQPGIITRIFDWLGLF